MYFYIHENNLHSSEVQLNNIDYIEISQEEYNEKLKIVLENKENSTVPDVNCGDWCESEEESIEL